MSHTLSANVLRFCALLRAEHDFALGPAEARDALRAVERAGVSDLGRVRCALRLVCCGKREDIPTFERVFEGFFLRTRGRRQTRYKPRHTREQQSPGEAGEGGETRQLETARTGDASTAWSALLARYSPAAGRAAAPAIPAEGLAEMLAAVSRLIAAARLGRSRRWRPAERGERFDLRRTLRRSLHTGGDPVQLRRVGHPLRNPRFVVLVDGSRSMAEHGALMLQFAYALCRRSRRTSVFLFSTELRDVSRELREPSPRDVPLAGLGDAWGGGTRIGKSLCEFLRGGGRRLLSDDTVTIVASDGLDLGDVAPLERAMREIRRRSAAVVWVNPLAGTEGYAPSARGMQAALPYVTSFAGARNAAALGDLL